MRKFLFWIEFGLHRVDKEVEYDAEFFEGKTTEDLYDFLESELKDLRNQFIKSGFKDIDVDDQ